MNAVKVARPGASGGSIFTKKKGRAGDGWHMPAQGPLGRGQLKHNQSAQGHSPKPTRLPHQAPFLIGKGAQWGFSLGGHRLSSLFRRITLPHQGLKKSKCVLLLSINTHNTAFAG
ncbi:MAG: hypothetical protein CR993_04230 [Rhodobacterales bacterium]|nr:MAG: hypothetical protein CR993_04230 [Rhodobacterales bacterium]